MRTSKENIPSANPIDQEVSITKVGNHFPITTLTDFEIIIQEIVYIRSWAVFIHYTLLVPSRVSYVDVQINTLYACRIASGTTNNQSPSQTQNYLSIQINVESDWSHFVSTRNVRQFASAQKRHTEDKRHIYKKNSLALHTNIKRKS